MLFSSLVAKCMFDASGHQNTNYAITAIAASRDVFFIQYDENCQFFETRITKTLKVNYFAKMSSR